MKGADKGVWCWAYKLLSKQRRIVVRGGIKWGEVVRPTVVASANWGQDPQWLYTQCESAVLVMFTAWIVDILLQNHGILIQMEISKHLYLHIWDIQCGSVLIRVHLLNTGYNNNKLDRFNQAVTDMSKSCWYTGCWSKYMWVESSHNSFRACHR